MKVIKDFKRKRGALTLPSPSSLDMGTEQSCANQLTCMSTDSEMLSLVSVTLRVRVPG